jgi:uncharacterized protein (TIGR02421 family)
MPESQKAMNADLIAGIRRRLANGQPVRRTLPEGGRVHIDRQLPFLVVYRQPTDRNDAGTARFVRGEASYLSVPAGRKYRRQTEALATAIATEMVRVFGSFLIIEVWSGPDSDAGVAPSGEARSPGFRVIVPRRDSEEASVSRLISTLSKIRVHGRVADVVFVPGGRLSPPGMTRLSSSFGTAVSAVRMIGIEIRPIHRSADSADVFPTVARSLHRQLSRAMQQAAYEFALHQTTHRPRHYQALGRRAFVKAVTEADRRLADIASAFDLLLQITPVNADRAYRSFVRKRASSPPAFRYRPIDIDPVLLKRALYRVPLDRVEDPTLAAIFREKQRELSMKLDLLSDRGTRRFIHTGLALYGGIDATMTAEAEALLDQLPPSSERGSGRSIDAASFAVRVEHELDRYRDSHPEMGANVSVRDDVSSLMVSNGSVLVGAGVRIPERRAEALLQHEVGTHVVTYWNGAAQRLRLLATGLAGHDELQEGLAVLAEYLVAGLTSGRIRVIAARVLAADSVVAGADFMDTYRMLIDRYGFTKRTAFQIAMRVHRGGGLVKDAVYLRGLHRVVSYLAEGGRLDTLLVGKISVDHVAVIEELQRRGVLRTPPLRPAYLDDPDSHYRLERLRGGVDLATLVEPT